MFSSALKSFASNITSNYTLESTPSASSGPWKIYDGKKKSATKAVSVFVFDKKSLEPQSGLGRSGASLKKAHEEVVERLKKEATSLARLRHPSILELAEPVEETRNGGLMFATEPVTASLAGLLAEKDGQEKASGVDDRSSRHAIGDAGGAGRRRREIELDDLEIQKGLLQIGKGLEFLHESAGLVHANLTPEAIYVNAKGDWKISGLGFSGTPENSPSTNSVVPISLLEILHYDSRLPGFVQLNLDYSSPDFVIDSNVDTSADVFSLGLLILALFNSPHTSPLRTNSSVSTYKRLFNTPSTCPTQSNQFLCSRPLPKELLSSVLPRLITRRPAQRMTALEFQESRYFDNILVSTIRFLDSLPAKSPNEKSQFMRGLSRVLTQFPKSVLEKKLLPALLEEMKDRDLLALVLQNVFRIIKTLPNGRRAFTEKVTPRLREVFLTGVPSSTNKGVATERDTAKEAGIMTILQEMGTVTENCSGKEFKDDVLPIVLLALESPTHPLIDASLRCIPNLLPVLDYTTLRNDLFPVVASVFGKTNSLGIKVRGLEAFDILCGGRADKVNVSGDGLDGVGSGDRSNSGRSAGTAVLDKHTVQDKVVPLLKGIKTKEPAVMMAALSVFKQVGKMADADFLAIEVLPIVWAMSLGPLLDLEQFRAFMDLVKSLSNRVEQEQIQKLQELSSNNNSSSRPGRGNDDFLSFGAANGASGVHAANGAAEDDFERLVSGGGGSSANAVLDGAATDSGNIPPVFSWSTPKQAPTTTSSLIPGTAAAAAGTLANAQAPAFRTITSDLGSFAALTPARGMTTTTTNPTPNPTIGSNASVPGGASGVAWSSTSATFSPPGAPPSAASMLGNYSGSGSNFNPWTTPASTIGPSTTTTTNVATPSSFTQPYTQAAPTTQATLQPLYPSSTFSSIPARPTHPSSSSSSSAGAAGVSFAVAAAQAQQSSQRPQATAANNNNNATRSLSSFSIPPPPGAISTTAPMASTSALTSTSTSASSASSVGAAAATTPATLAPAQQAMRPNLGRGPASTSTSGTGGGLNKYKSLL